MKKIYHLICVLFLLCINFTVFAQVEPNKYLLDIVPPSPMAYEMTRFEAQQPDLYTGIASVGIPLYTIDFDGWQLPLSLSYQASGIRTNQEATEVGLGWALSATAVITRQVRAINDFHFSNNYKGYIHNTEDYNAQLLNYNNLTANERLTLRTQIKGDFIDVEPDIFNYNFFGFSGSFSLSRNARTNFVEVIKHDVNAVEIIFNDADPLSAGDEDFEIITPTGFRGYFTIKERSTNMSGAGTKGMNLDDNGNLIDVQTIINRGNFRVVTGWYLEKIVSPNGKEINFDYNISSSENSNYVSVTSPAFGEERLPSFVNIFDNGGFFLYRGTQDQVSFSRQVHEHVYQEKITIPGEVEISFVMEDRDDLEKNHLYANAIVDVFPQNYLNLQTPKRYKNISIIGLNPSSNYSKDIEIAQSYFNFDKLYENNVAYNQYQYLRSRLDFVKIDDQIYNLEYAYGEKGLPVKSTLGVDHFGYYNGNDTNQALYPLLNGYNLLTNDVNAFADENNITYGNVYNCSVLPGLPNRMFYVQRQDRKPNINHGISGALVKIQYPTRGSSTYEYESHEYYTNGKADSPSFLIPEAINYSGQSGDVTAGGLRIKSIHTRDENNKTVNKKSYEYKNSLNFSSGLLMTPMVYLQNTSENNSLFEFDAVTQGGGSLCLNVFHYQLSIPGSNTAGGQKIGYSRVIENMENDTSNESYKSFYEFENVAATFTGVPPKVMLRSNFNGKPISQIDANSLGSIKQLTEFEKVSNTQGGVDAIAYSNAIFDFGAGLQEGQGGIVVKKLYLSPLRPYVTPIETVNISQTSTTLNYASGNVNTNINYEFNDKNQVTSEESTNSKNQVIRKVYKRLKEFESADCSFNNDARVCMKDIMSSRNIIDPILEEITYVDGVVTSAIGYRYGLEGGNVVLKETFTYDRSREAYIPTENGFDFTESYESRVTYDLYDNEGNLLQQTLKDGTPVSYIWEYDREYPIVTARNINYTDLGIAYKASLGANYEEQLREHPLTKQTLITTYEFDPLVGITKVTDPSGISTSYEYDEFRRLIETKDLDGNILQKNNYKHADILKSNGLSGPSGLNFNVVNPGTSKTEYVKIVNNGNYAITVDDLELPENFSSVWDNRSFFIPQGGEFNIAVTFNSPLTNLGSYSGVLKVLSDDINGDLFVSLNAVAGEETKILRIEPLCQVMDIGFGNYNLMLHNDGNSTLSVRNVFADDDCISNEWGMIMRDANQSIIPYEIPPNSSVSITVQLTCPFSGTGTPSEIWDEDTMMNVAYYNEDNILIAEPFQVVRNDTSCTTIVSPPPGPAFTVTGDVEADCSSGMSGSVTVNMGSVRVVNYFNQISGVGGIGATINITGTVVNSLGPGGSVIITPTTYPATLNFTSNNFNCSNGFGTSEIRVFEY